MMPMSARTGVKDDGFKRFTQILLPLMPARLNSHAVTVVPTFAAHDNVDGLPQCHEPGVYEAHYHDCRRRRALNDGCDAEARQKARRYTAGHFIEQALQLARPARRSKACPIRFMPNRKRHSPPIIVSTLKISIPDFPLLTFFYTYRSISCLCQINCVFFVKSM